MAFIILLIVQALKVGMIMVAIGQKAKTYILMVW
jgi:hypothetical protein